MAPSTPVVAVVTLTLLALSTITQAQRSLPPDIVAIPRPHLCDMSLCFVFDESGSVRPNEFLNAKSAARTMVYAAGSDSTFSAVEYASSPAVIQATTGSVATIISAINANTQGGGGTDSDEGMNLCAAQLSGPGAAVRPRVLVLFTDGHDAPSPSVMAAASTIKGMGIWIVVVNIDAAPTYLSALQNIASTPALASMFSGYYPNLVAPGAAIEKVICSRCCPAAHVCYAIDESGSISTTEFAQMTSGLVSTTSVHSFFAHGSQYAAVQFSNTAAIVSPFVDGEAMVDALIGNSDLEGGWTSSGSALRICNRLLYNKPGSRVIVLVTDGYDNVVPYGIDVANDIKAGGVSIVTVGVGGFVNDMDLALIASPNAFVKVADFPSFPAAVGPIVHAVCHARPAVPMRSVLGLAISKKARRCAVVTCVGCGAETQCFVRSGNTAFDEKACASVTGSGVRTALRTCRLRLTSRAPVKCFAGTDFGAFGRGGDSAVCRGASVTGASRTGPLSFTQVTLCDDGKRSVATCESRKCTVRSPTATRCWAART